MVVLRRTGRCGMSQEREERADVAAEAAPFGLDLSMAGIDRATRIAKSLFPDFEATIILVDEGNIWRSHNRRNASLEDDPAAATILAGGEMLWVEDAALDPRFSNHPLVAGPLHRRFYAGVPIRIADGSTPGVLCVVGPTPQAFNAVKASRLQDLADFVADDWARASAARASSLAEKERDTARA